MMTDDHLAWLAGAVLKHLSRADARLVAECCSHHTARMLAYLNLGAGQPFTPDSYARFALQCAKRVMAGPAA